MSENLRSLAAGLRKSVKGLIGAPHRQITMPISVSMDIERKTGNLQHSSAPLTVSGKTQEISKNSIAFILPFVRLGDHYIAGHGGEQKRLKLLLELPNGTVRLIAQPERMEMIELHDSVQQYLIGAKIVEVSEGDRERYEEFVKRGDKVKQDAAPDRISAEKKGTLFGFIHSIF